MAEGKKQMSAYIDSNIFIYSIIDDGALGEQAREILEMVQNGALDAYTSVLTFDEIVFIVKKIKGQKQAIAAGTAFLDFNNLRIVETKKETARLALQAMEKYSLLPRDAIHYSTMKLLGLTEIVSEDKDFKQIKEINCRTIKEFLKHD